MSVQRRRERVFATFFCFAKQIIKGVLVEDKIFADPKFAESVHFNDKVFQSIKTPLPQSL
jgi:hypothetical protein